MADYVYIGGPGYNSVFESTTGIVGRDLDRRATLVQNAARSLVGTRYATGRLRRDISKKWVPSRSGRMVIQVGSSLKHAMMHHEGTKPHIIRARNARALRYINRDGNVVFATAVHHPGTRANRYLENALPLALR